MRKIFSLLSLSALATPTFSYDLMGVGTSTWTADYACNNARDHAEDSADSHCKQIDSTSRLSAIRFGDRSWTLSGETFTCRISAFFTCY